MFGEGWHFVEEDFDAEDDYSLKIEWDWELFMKWLKFWSKADERSSTG